MIARNPADDCEWLQVSISEKQATAEPAGTSRLSSNDIRERRDERSHVCNYRQQAIDTLHRREVLRISSALAASAMASSVPGVRAVAVGFAETGAPVFLKGHYRARPCQGWRDSAPISLPNTRLATLPVGVELALRPYAIASIAGAG